MRIYKLELCLKILALNYLRAQVFIGKLSVINRGEYKQSIWDKLFRVNINHLRDMSE